MSNMVYKIQYLPLAVQDLNGIANYLSNFYSNSTVRVLKLLREKIEKLAQTPRMCAVYPQEPFYRKLVADQYIVFYRIREEKKIVEIHRILRGSWNLPVYLE